jgi:hypothetical protein
MEAGSPAAVPAIALVIPAALTPPAEERSLAETVTKPAKRKRADTRE